jgi:hypothetical protein
MHLPACCSLLPHLHLAQALISQGYQTTGTASKPAAAAATAGGEEVAASGRSAGASDASAAAGTMSAGQPGGGEQPSLETSSLTLMAGDVGTALMRLEDHLRTKVGAQLVAEIIMAGGNDCSRVRISCIKC